MEIVFYIPTYDKEYIKKASKLISEIDNGLTVFYGLKGLWKDNGKMYKDDITLIQIIIDINKTLWLNLQKVNNIALMIKDDLKQIAFMYTINNVKVIV